MFAYYQFELKRFILNKKNIAAFLLLLAATLFYTLIIVPQYEPIEGKVNRTEIENEMIEGIYYMEQYDPEESYTDYYASLYPGLIEINQVRLEGLDSNNLEQYVEATLDWYAYPNIHTDTYRAYNSPYEYFAEMEAIISQNRTVTRFREYLDQDIALSESVLEERTALQTFQRTIELGLPFILLALTVVFSNDILVSDNKHQTLVNSFPLSFKKRLNIKTLVVLTGVFGSLFFTFLLGSILVGARYGFGSLHFSIGIYDSVQVFLGLSSAAAPITLGQYFLRSLILFILADLVFIRGILLLSTVFKNEFVNLVAGLAAIFSERLYYMRGIGFSTNVDLYPPTFFDIGNVLTGYQNHLYTSTDITFQNGVLSMGLLLLINEFILFIAVKSKESNLIKLKV